ncbi:MAG: hypothetical protein ACYTEL_11605 [Planctomycetota bacterium]|jgi:hypothetical protein
MKRRVMLVVGILMVVGLAWVAFAQSQEAPGKRPAPAEGRRDRRSMWRQRQQKAVTAIEEELAKMKAGLESVPARREGWRDLPEEERNKLREKFRKLREERQKSIVVIEDQIALLKGGRSLHQEHEKSISELDAIRELATKEKAKETTAGIEKLIADKKKAFEERLKKLELPQRRGRRSS